MDKKKILDNALNNLRKDVEKTFTNEDNLKKTFLNRLENTLPEPTVFELIKKKWKAFSAIFASLVSTGFIVAQLMIPLQFATKGIENDNSHIDELSSEQIQVYSKEDFEFIMKEAVKFELDINLETMGNYRQLFIQSLLIDEHDTIKEKLNLDSAYQGPVTIVIKND